MSSGASVLLAAEGRLEPTAFLVRLNSVHRCIHFPLGIQPSTQIIHTLQHSSQSGLVKLVRCATVAGS